jgi:hypothetical protein
MSFSINNIHLDGSLTSFTNGAPLLPPWQTHQSRSRSKPLWVQDLTSHPGPNLRPGRRTTRATICPITRKIQEASRPSRYPQQATPLTSDQGVLEQAKLYDRSPETVNEIMVSDGLAPDDPENPRGTPDYIVEPHGEPQNDAA